MNPLLSAIFRNVAFFVCAAFQFPVWAFDVIYYSPEHVGNSISGRIFVDTAPPNNHLNMSVFGCGAGGASQALNWTVGDFTGVYPAKSLRSVCQRGVNNGIYGSTAVQMTDLLMGAHLDTRSLPSRPPFGLSNLQVKYVWSDSTSPRPWTRNSSKLRFAFQLRIPNASVEGGGIGYIYASLLLKDNNGKVFWLQPQIFDTRGSPTSEFLGWDAGTNSGYVASYYASTPGVTRYCARTSTSYSTTGIKWSNWRLYEFQITRAHLLNAVNDMNGRFGSGLSTNTSNYRIVMFTIQNEIYWPVGHGSLSMGVKDVYIKEQYQ